jgi:hypothetical protein
MPKLSRKIEIDNFRITSVGIEAYCLIDGESVDFNINQDEFETWCDYHEMREWNNDSYSYYSNCWMEDNGTTPWEEIYDNHPDMYNFLKCYIENLYILQATDIETPIKKICTESLDNSLSTLGKLQQQYFPIAK